MVDLIYLAIPGPENLSNICCGKHKVHVSTFGHVTRHHMHSGNWSPPVLHNGMARVGSFVGKTFLGENCWAVDLPSCSHNIPLGVHFTPSYC
jgi:hypothetical protein